MPPPNDDDNVGNGDNNTIVSQSAVSKNNKKNNNNNNNNNDNRQPLATKPSLLPLQHSWILKKKYSQWIVAIVTIIFLIEWILNYNNICRLDEKQSSTTTTKNNDNNNNGGWVRPDVVYGLVHIAKTAGTTINGELATRYERVCGNKGYSYDYAMVNKEFKKYVQETGGDRSVNFPSATAVDPGPFQENNGLKNDHMMEKVIGYDDCDYIASEHYPWMDGRKLFDDWKMELHVPCREPVDHLLSIYNFRKARDGLHHVVDDFNCSNPNLLEELNKHIPNSFISNRFKWGLMQHPNFTVKCFESNKVKPYLEYMGNMLQEKRLPGTYEHRATNIPRNKSNECLWNDPGLAKKYRQLMRKTYAYYRFCDICIGTKDDLLV